MGHGGYTADEEASTCSQNTDRNGDEEIVGDALRDR